MVEPGDVLEAPRLGLRIEVRRTAAETGGEVTEFDVVGRPRGFIVTPHVHHGQTERHEVIEGAMAIRMHGRTRILGPGEFVETPPGTTHSHKPAGEGAGRVRVTMRPAGRIEAFVEELGRMDRDGELTRAGYPRPVPGARFTLAFLEDAHGAFPPPGVQRVIARGILALDRRLSNAYAFTDEWDVAAPVEAVFAAIGDAATYPDWWRPTYLDVRTEGEPGVGHVVHHHFRGPLPYTLKATTRTTRFEPPGLVESEVEGDLQGTGRWTLTPTEHGTHVRFDWHVSAEHGVLRALSPLLRPVFRWNHGWAIARAKEGLERYAAAHAPEVTTR